MHLNYETYGDGPPLVILHGLFGSLENWRTVAKQLAADFRVYLLDLRNHGRSPHSDVFDYPAMAGDVKEFLQQHDLRSVFLMGHSMGGKVAMQCAVTWPQLVQKLVVVDMAPKPYNPQHREILDALLSLHLERYTERRAVDVALSDAIPDTGIRLFLLKNLVTNEAGRFTWRINLEAISRNYDELVQGIDTGSAFDGPTLFIKGENSNYVRPEDATLIRRLFPAARLLTVPAAGHWVHADNPGFFVHSVVSFLIGQ